MDTIQCLKCGKYITLDEAQNGSHKCIINDETILHWNNTMTKFDEQILNMAINYPPNQKKIVATQPILIKPDRTVYLLMPKPKLNKFKYFCSIQYKTNYNNRLNLFNMYGIGDTFTMYSRRQSATLYIITAINEYGICGIRKY